jgi:hypothetical protein
MFVVRLWVYNKHSTYKKEFSMYGKAATKYLGCFMVLVGTNAATFYFRDYVASVLGVTKAVSNRESGDSQKEFEVHVGVAIADDMLLGDERRDCQQALSFLAKHISWEAVVSGKVPGLKGQTGFVFRSSSYCATSAAE